MKKVVTMDCTFSIHFESPIDLNVATLDIGGFEVQTERGIIPFDYDASGYSHEKLNEQTYRIRYKAGYGAIFNDYDISKDFNSAYAKLGLKRKDITAKLLASASAITEFNIDCSEEDVDFTCEILSMSFTDETGTVYAVDKAVIDDFNINQ